MELSELWTIRTLANSALVNSDPKKFGPSQFGPRPLVNSDPDHWSIRTLFYWSIRTSKIKILWSLRTFSVGQFGPFPFVNSDLFRLSIWTFSIGHFGPSHYVISTKKTAFILKTNHSLLIFFAVLYDGLAFHKVKLRFALTNLIHQTIVNYKTQSTRRKQMGCLSLQTSISFANTTRNNGMSTTMNFYFNDLKTQAILPS